MNQKPSLSDIYGKSAVKEAGLEWEKLKLAQKSTIGRPLKKGGGYAKIVKYNRNLNEFIGDFWIRVLILKNNECWNWRGSLTKNNGYGCVGLNRFMLKCHRVSYEIKNGFINKNLLVCHSCDNPKCVNPNHLFQGTHKDNSQDCINKKRFKKEKGSQRYNAILTESIVKKLRKEYKTKKIGWGIKMAKKYGVCKTAISNVVKNYRWKDVL